MAQKVKLNTNFAGQVVPAEAEVVYYSQAEAAMRGVKTLVICWVVGLICVFVPVLHFVLTPAAILAGPVAGILVYIRTQKLPKLVDGKTQCGHCKAETAFNFQHQKPPFYDSCKSCKTGYEILWPPQA